MNGAKGVGSSAPRNFLVVITVFSRTKSTYSPEWDSRIFPNANGVKCQLKLTEELRGWEPPMRSKARVRVKPKRYFCDPSLACALLGAAPESLLRDTQTLGMLFENLVIRDLRVFLSTYSGLGNDVFYYRDENGLEVDAIVQRGGSWGAIEVKLSDTKADDGARNLLKLRDKLCANPLTQTAQPAFLAVVVGRGSLAYTRDDGVQVIPAALLGA